MIMSVLNKIKKRGRYSNEKITGNTNSSVVMFSWLW